MSELFKDIPEFVEVRTVRQGRGGMLLFCAFRPGWRCMPVARLELRPTLAVVGNASCQGDVLGALRCDLMQSFEAD